MDKDQMRGVTMVALSKGGNTELRHSLNRLPDTPHKSALQAMSLLIRPKVAQAKDTFTGGSGIRFDTKTSAKLLSSATKGDQDVANQYLKAMNYAADNGFISNTGLGEVYSNMGESGLNSLFNHCFELSGSAQPTTTTGTTRAVSYTHLTLPTNREV